MSIWDTINNTIQSVLPKKKSEAVLQARVGEGMTPEQTTKAYETIAKKDVAPQKSNISNFWDKINTPAPSLQAKVGEGLTPEQSKIASETVRKVDPYASNPAWQSKSYYNNESFGQKLNFAIGVMNSPNATKEEKRQAFDIMSSPAIGASTGITPTNKIPLKNLFDFFVKEVNPTVIEDVLTKQGIDSVIAKKISPQLAGAKSVPEVQQIILDAEMPNMLNGSTKIQFTGNETPEEILAKSEADAAGKHLTPEQIARQDFNKTWQNAYGNRPATINTSTSLDLLRKKNAQDKINFNYTPIDETELSNTKNFINETANEQTTGGRMVPSRGNIATVDENGKWMTKPSTDMLYRQQAFYGVPEDILYKISKGGGGTGADLSIMDIKRLADSLKENGYTNESTGLIVQGYGGNDVILGTTKLKDGQIEYIVGEVSDKGKLKNIRLHGTNLSNKEILGRVNSFSKLINPDEVKSLPTPHLKYDQNGNPLAYTAKEQAIVNKVPFVPKPVQPSVPKPSLVDTTTGEGLSLERLANQEKGTSVLKDNSSLIDIIKKDPTSVKAKANIIDYTRTPDRVLTKFGLEEEAKYLRTQYEKYLMELPKNIDKVSAWGKRMSSTGNQDIFRWLDGEPIELKPEDKQVAIEIKQWLKQWADKLGLKSEDRITHYITHIFDKELIAKEFPEELAKMIDNKLPGEVYDPFLQERLGKLGYRQDTLAALDAYVKRATRKVYMDPALEKVKTSASGLEQSQYDFIKSYISKINMRPSKIDNLIDNGIKQLIGYKLGQRPLLTITRFMRQMTYRAFLGLNPASAIKNISQGINTYAKLGEKYTTIGYIKLFQKGAKEELEREGVLNAGFIEDRALSSTKKLIEKFDKVLFFFFETAEHINRGSAYFGGKAQGLAKGMSEQDAIEYGKKIVRDTQFVFGRIDTPLILSSDLGKTLGQFQSFTIKQMEFLLEMGKGAVKGNQKLNNLIGLLRYAMAGTLFVYTIGKAFGMKVPDLIPSYRIGVPPSLKLPYEIGRAITNAPDQYNQPRDMGQKLKDVGNTLWGVIPAGTQIKKTLQGVQAVNQGKSTDAAGRPQFDVGGNFWKDAQAYIFGKYAGQPAQDYFNNDVTYTEATLNNLKKSKTAKADFDKIIKDNPALAKNVLELIKKQKLGVTDDDQKLLNLGVANKARAKEVAKQFNKLKTKEEKAQLFTEYVNKKIITKDVANQLSEFLNK